MSTNNNPKKEQINNLLKDVSGRLGTSPDKLKSALQSGKLDNIVNNLNLKDANKIKTALSDKNMVSKMLDSPQVQKLIKNILGDNKPEER